MDSDSLYPLTRSMAAYCKSVASSVGGSGGVSRDHHMTATTPDHEMAAPTSGMEELQGSKSAVSLRRSNRLSASTNKRLSDHALHVSIELK